MRKRVITPTSQGGVRF